MIAIMNQSRKLYRKLRQGIRRNAVGVIVEVHRKFGISRTSSGLPSVCLFVLCSYSTTEREIIASRGKSKALEHEFLPSAVISFYLIYYG